MSSIDRESFCFINKDLSIGQFFSAFNKESDKKHIANIAEEQKSKVREMFEEIERIVY